MPEEMCSDFVEYAISDCSGLGTELWPDTSRYKGMYLC